MEIKDKELDVKIKKPPSTLIQNPNDWKDNGVSPEYRADLFLRRENAGITSSWYEE